MSTFAARKIALCVLGMLTMFCAAGCHDVKRVMGNTFADQPVQWGQPVNGLQVGLAQRDFEPGYAPAGGQRYFALHLKNAAAKPIKIFWPDKPPFGVAEFPLEGNESLAVIMINQTAAGKNAAEFKPPHKPVLKELDPGEEIIVQVRLTNSKLGAGTLTGTYSNQQSQIDYKGSGGLITGIWTGSATSGAVSIDLPAPAPSSK